MYRDFKNILVYTEIVLRFILLFTDYTDKHGKINNRKSRFIEIRIL